MKVIFLDIDGVLVTHGSLKLAKGLPRYKQFDKKCVQHLNWLATTTGAEIVVSSTWRLFGLANLRQMFREAGIAKEILDLTPHIPGVPRGREIAAWLAGQSEVERFVILDDDGDMEHLLPHLVKTSNKNGLRSGSAVVAAAMYLNGFALRITN